MKRPVLVWAVLGLMAAFVVGKLMFAPAPQTAAPDNAAPQPEPVPAALTWPGPALHHHRTPAGLSVAIHPSEDVDQHAAVVLVLPYGFAHEPAEQWGAVSLAAALLDRAPGLVPNGSGETLLDADALTAWMQGQGMTIQTQPGPDHVMVEVEAPDLYLDNAVTLACALAFDPHWDQDAYEEAALAVSQHQAELYANGAALAQQVANMVLFQGHALSRPVLPPPDVYPDLAAVESWWRRMARPQEALLLVNTQRPEAVLRAAQRCRVAGEPAAPPNALPQVDPASPVGNPRRLGVVGPPGTTAHVMVAGRAPPSGTMELAALAAALETLGNGFSSVLVHKLRTQLGLVYGVEATWQHARQGGVWTISTSTRVEHVERVLSGVEETLANIDTHGVDPAAWRRMARATALSFAQGAEDPLALLAMEADHFRLGRPPGDGWRFPRLLWEAQPEHAAAVAQALLGKAGRVLVVVAPATAWQGPLRARVDAVAPPP